MRNQGKPFSIRFNMSSVDSESILPTRVCAYCGKQLEGKRRHARYCNDTCRMSAYRQREMAEEIRAAQEHGVADVERQLADGAERIFVEGRALSREAAWTAAAGLRATWAIDGARATAQHVFEGGQWWVMVQVPLGEFPG